MMAKASHHKGAVFLQLRLPNGFRFGPGKAALLSAVEKSGSITGAAKRVGMSYRRAWTLVSEMNATFREPVVITRVGGLPEGAATLGELGRQLCLRYSELEQQVDEGSSQLLAFMAEHATERPPE